jgi:hypothetical protein
MRLAWAALIPASGEDGRLSRETRQAALELLERTEIDEDAHHALVQELLSAPPSYERLLLVGQVSEDLAAAVCRASAETYAAWQVGNADKSDLVGAHLDVLAVGADLQLAEAAYVLALAQCSTQSRPTRRQCARAEEGRARTRPRGALAFVPPMDEEQAQVLIEVASLEGRLLGICGSAMWRESQELRAGPTEAAARAVRQDQHGSCAGVREW